MTQADVLTFDFLYTNESRRSRMKDSFHSRRLARPYAESREDRRQPTMFADRHAARPHQERQPPARDFGRRWSYDSADPADPATQQRRRQRSSPDILSAW